MTPNAPPPPIATGTPGTNHRPGTLRRRLIGSALGGLLVAMLALGLTAYLLLTAAVLDREAAASASAAALIERSVSEAPPQERAAVLRRLAAAAGIERLALRRGDHALFESGVTEEPPAGLGRLLSAATLAEPLHLIRLPVLPPAGGPRAAGGVVPELEVGVRSTQHAATLKRLGLRLVAAMACVFAAVGLVVVVLMIRLTAPLPTLRSAVLRARQAGRTGSVEPVPAPRGRQRHGEIEALCRVVDAMGADIADARQRIVNANEELSQQVKARTAELSQANRQLELEAEDKNHFLRAVSHDLNAPLRNIDGLSRLLMSKHAAELSEGAASRLERICINVKQQHELISDLLELSKLRTKAHRPTILRLGELVDEVAKGLGFDLETARIGFEMRGEWPVIHAERNRMRQVFQNLIDNAIKYMMDSTERRITVGVVREHDFEADVFKGVDSYRFTVADTGRGIAAEDLHTVYRVFARAIHSGTHAVPGRGVGLASVEAIVRGYGGRVGVESTLGSGSRFWFTLPVAAVASNPAAGAEATSAEPEPPKTPGSAAPRVAA
ncbi:sensor histidine kinase [Phycisphaera mikurensis]|nr:HAMP domain-containing sensor histidine kinase [Phycisphaera mikurensis]MBB6442640.1 signal transduction histidine kinase [Phycisphaera mikurensis]